VSGGGAVGAIERPSVLVVDDEADNLRTFARVFRGHLDLRCASSGAEAIELMRGAPFDVALVDYSMPEMNGLELLARAAELRPAMARLLLTAHADLDEVRAGLGRGLCVHIIRKPWDRDDVLRWVATCHRMAAMRASVSQMNSKLNPGR
jgi:CheY-like chemotaxis protein